MGDGERGDQGREEERIGARQEDHAHKLAKGWQEGWAGFRHAQQSRPLGIGPEGGGDAEASRRWRPEVDGPKVHRPEVDGPEVDGPEVDAPEVDDQEVDRSEVDRSQVGGSEIDRPEVELPESGRSVPRT